MRTTVIPAQITTVEDKIAGSFNLTQIMILMVPVIWTTIVYSTFPQRMHLSWYKFPLVLIVLFTCLLLALRIKGKVILNWLIDILRYNLRPKYYLFNKNEAYFRTMDLPIFERKSKKVFKKVEVKEEVKLKAPAFSISDLVIFESFLRNKNFSFSLKTNQKGGLDVGLKQVKP